MRPGDSRPKKRDGRVRTGQPVGAVAFLLLGLLALPTAHADGAMTARRISQLYHAYYAYGVADYCGFVTGEVNDGYERQVRYFLLTADIDKETERRIRISGSVEADYQFDNHGLGGFRQWCATDGRRAEREFLAFRNLQLSKAPD